MPSTERRVAQLDNGLTVILQPSHASSLISLWAWYRIGSGDEPPGQTGISHWVEHMNFKGTARLSREAMTGVVERHGGLWNGYTWIDQTTYVSTAHRDALDDLLLLESERMSACLYDEAECESERTVIISELQGAENDPDQLLETEVTAAALSVHPYRHPTIGWRRDLETMTRDDLLRHYERYHAPDNAAVVIAGDIDSGDALARVERAFGAIAPSGVTAPARPAEPPQGGERRVVVERPGGVGYVKLAHRAPAFAHDDFAPMLVLDAILNGARGLNLWCSFRALTAQRRSRMYRALVERGLASAVQGALMPTRDAFLHYLSITAAEGVPLEAVEQAASDAIGGLITGGASDEDVSRARRQLHARMVFEGDSVTNIAHQAGYFQTIGALAAYDALPARLAAVTPDDVKRVAAAYLRPASRTVGFFRPGASS
ncbi:MAG TPA: pitrilysin family protein [Vicinamibacterales bacterium]|nr:pitrilysin family protein [Vicinamibacterales bacterium]